MLAGRRIVLGVTGGVAAYKTAALARRLLEAGATVRPVMTQAATRFLGPQTLAALTGTHPVVDLFGDRSVSPHTELARWAEAVVVAPTTAATLARLAHGLAADAVAATVLATTAPVLLAPAMHTEMWEHPATRRNVATLLGDGVRFVGPETGELAGGDVGAGRMAEPEDIVAELERVLAAAERLSGWRVLVDAGGTREPIDPVRYIGNRSSGKMGNAIALVAAERGAHVVLVTTAPPATHPRIRVVSVETAAEMAEAVWREAPDQDVAVFAAAVADFRPASPAPAKLRRSTGLEAVALEPTPDVLGGVATLEHRPFIVGFAAETGGLDEAIAKARRKGVDLLVANDVTRAGSGFGTDTNEVTLVYPDGRTEAWEVLPKRVVAERLWDRIEELRRPEARS